MRSSRSSGTIGTALVAATLVVFGAINAGARDRGDERREAVRRAVEAGEIQPLADILTIVRGKLAGDIAGIGIERDGDRWRYEFRVIDSQGRVLEVYVDARTGVIERTREK